MVIITKYRLEHNEENIWILISLEDPVCPECGSTLSRRDMRKRIYRQAGGETQWILIFRLKCTNDDCGRLHHELPDCVFPYKHYRTDVIEDVVDGVVGAEDLETEDYPCEGTMNHWKWWMLHNEVNIDCQLKSVAHRILDFGVEFLKLELLLLREIRNRISRGWLSSIAGYIYNSGGRIEPYPGI